MKEKRRGRILFIGKEEETLKKKRRENPRVYSFYSPSILFPMSSIFIIMFVIEWKLCFLHVKNLVYLSSLSKNNCRICLVLVGVVPSRKTIMQ